MLRQAENKCYIEGILSESDINYGSYQKNGVTVECIRGTIKVLVETLNNGIPTTNEIPITLFANKMTTKGEINKSYLSIEECKNTCSSIATTGSKNTADKIKMTAAITMNEYFAQGRLISYPRLTASFISKVTADKFKPKAVFSCEVFVANHSEMIDANGELITDADGNPRYQVMGVIPQYGGKVDVVKFICSNNNVADAIKSMCEPNTTIKFNGILNFTQHTEVVKEEQAFGDPIERSRTTNISEVIITGGSDPYDGDMVFTKADIDAALAERKVRLEELKQKDASNPRGYSAPAPADTVSNPTVDLGF